jgi:hypothetical protein
MTPPAIAELVLSAIISEPEIEEVVLGDLAEAWGQVAAVTGRSTANRWYWRQTVQSVPHFVRAWWDHASRATVLRTLGAVSVAYLTTGVFLAGTEFPLRLALGALGFSPDSLLRHVALLILGVGALMSAGAAAALAGRHAPLVTVLTFSFSWLAVMSVAAVFERQPWDGYAIIILLVPSVVVGGVMAVRRLKPATP